MTLQKNKINRRAVIVASGPSALHFIPPEDVTVIAVNGAIDWLSRVDYFFTLDPSAENIRRLKHRRKGTLYCAAGEAIPDVITYQRIEYRGQEPQPRGTPEWWLWRWSAVKTLAVEQGKIHSGNSAWGALGLAYHLGFKDVALVGVDGTNEEKIGGGKCNNLSHLPLLFSSALSQINLTSCGKLKGIPYMDFEEWYENSIDRNTDKFS